MNVRLHDRVRLLKARAVLLDESLARPLPDFAETTLEYVDYLAAAHEQLGDLVNEGAELYANAALYAEHAPPTHRGESAERLWARRNELGDVLLAHADTLANTRFLRTGRNWTLFMATWVVLAQANVVLERLRRGPDDDADAAAADSADTNACLAADELLTSQHGLDDVPFMSLGELRLALDVLRARLTSLPTLEHAHARYLVALESRASEFVCGAVPAAEYAGTCRPRTPGSLAQVR